MSEDDYIRVMALKMKQKLDTYQGNLLIVMLAVLDPRFKMMLVEFCCPEIYLETKVVANIFMVHHQS